MTMRSIKLKDASILITKGTTPTTHGFEFVEKGMPFLRAEDINGEIVNIESTSKKISAECHSAFKRSQLRAGDVLITIAGSVGRVGLIPNDFSEANCNQAVCIVRLKPGLFENQFLLYALRSTEIQAQFRKQGTTATITNVSLAQIGDLEVPMPTIEEQRKVIEILLCAEGIIRLRREAKAKAQAIIPALFLDMFGDPATNPKGWPVRTVRQIVARFEGGKNLQAGDAANTPFRILKVSAVTSGCYLENESKPAPLDLAPATSHFVRPGDMLFSRANTQELVGATALVETTNGQTLMPDKLWRFVWSEPVDQRYMHTLFQSQYVRRELGKLSTGTSASMRNISQEKLYRLPLPVAPIEGQRAFGRLGEATQSVLALQNEALKKAETTFQSLLAQAFNATLIATSLEREDAFRLNEVG